MEKDTNKRLKKLSKFDSDLRKFGIYFAIGMALLLSIAFLRNWQVLAKSIVAGLLLYHIIFAFLFPKALVVTYFITKVITKIVGTIITYVVFGLLYYLLFTPIAIIIRASKKDHIKNNSISPHWIECLEKDNDPKKIEKLF